MLSRFACEITVSFLVAHFPAKQIFSVSYLDIVVETGTGIKKDMEDESDCVVALFAGMIYVFWPPFCCSPALLQAF